ncbi:uncharacterized protein LY79DRAFT_567718 [Colletotrichum navitas]|uniref:Uncharacterized protein n=1 Tax=Colletotrichum navitas TaxID=681940 RepID=A0AAD8UZN0_9PEZI|nr:uncharacterized protein LY79DRAFT_567718 [Colletotrichum navitas]KAK1573822.1 hypothetical protein LY79DRAFT_567718 [Colletotrichum navitas]
MFPDISKRDGIHISGRMSIASSQSGAGFRILCQWHSLASLNFTIPRTDTARARRLAELPFCIYSSW